MVGYSAMWRGSKAARQVARGEEEDPESKRSTFRWDWGRKTCGIVGRDWAKSCVTLRSPDPLQAGTFHSLSGRGQNPLAPHSTLWIQERSRLWPKTRPSMGLLASCTIPRGLSPLDLASHFLYSLRSHCRLVTCSIFLFSSKFFPTNVLFKPLLHSSSHSEVQSQHPCH